MKNSKKTHLKERGYKVLKFFLAPLFKVYYHPKLKNIEVIPSSGPVIFAGNHRHILDQCLVIISTKRVVHYLAKKEYFTSPFAWFFKVTGVIFVDRSIHDEQAKEKALEVLNHAGAIGIFPEGTRNKTENLLLPFKYGAVSLAQKSDATIVPFGLKGKFAFRSRPSIEFGEPFKVSDFSDLQDANEHLKKCIEDVLTK